MTNPLNLNAPVDTLAMEFTRDFDAPFQLPGGIEATFLPAGHILGAAQVHLRVGGRTVHFTGDLGRAQDPLMYPPRALEPVNVLVAESTYGNREHPAVQTGGRGIG